MIRTQLFSLSSKFARLLIAFSICSIFYPRNSLVFLVATTLLGLVFLTARTVFVSLASIPVGVATATIFASMPFLKNLVIEGPAIRLFLVFALSVVGFCIVSSRYGADPTRKADPYAEMLCEVIPALVFAITSHLWIFRSPTAAFGFLLQSEDNSAWLQGLSYSFKSQGHLIFSSDGSWSGGIGLAAWGSILQFVHSFSFGTNFTRALNPLVLVHGYGFLIASIMAIFVSLALRFSSSEKSHTATSALGVAFGTSLVVYGTSALISVSGHLSFLIVIWILSCAMGLSALRRTSTAIYGVYSRIIFALLGIFAALVWIPLTPLGLGMVIISLAPIIYRRLIRSFTSYSDFRKSFPIIFALLGFFVYSWIALGGVMRVGLNPAWVNTTLTYAGGITGLSPLLFAVVIMTLLFLAITIHGPLGSDLIFAKSILGLLAIYVLALDAFSWLGKSGGLNYAALKTTFLLAALTLPISVAFLSNYMQDRIRKYGAVVCAVIVALVMFNDGTLASKLTWPSSNKDYAPAWAPYVIESAQNYPEREIICIDTTLENIKAYDSYTCGRISAGLLGSVDNPDIDTWAPLGLYLADVEPLLKLPEDFFSNLTIVAMDPNNRTSKDPLIDKVLQRIPWSIVHVVGPSKR